MTPAAAAAVLLSPPCPSNSFIFNASLCSCNPGFLYNASTRACDLFTVSGDNWVVHTGVVYTLNFPGTIFSFDLIKRYTQSQAMFLLATAFMILSWLVFCLFLRVRKLGDGRSIWFQIRWWISRLDICFSTRHWLDDQKVVMKRKTELGGTLSIASWILCIGLCAALLFQIISNRAVEIHNVRATDASELASFTNDMEFNITTISSMSCAHWRDMGTLVTGNPGFVDYRVDSLSRFAEYSCQNTSQGPTIILKCENCQIVRDTAHISWQFVDLPNNPATAVGFQFNLTARNHASNKHLTFVGGMLKNGSSGGGKFITYRGAVPNVLKFNLFPRVYRNLHNLRLIQPLFHEFIPGSSYSEISELQASLQSSKNGLVNITLDVNFLSDYIVEVDNQNIMGPVSFLADLGGLYCISMAMFFYFLVQCEYRVKKLRSEDTIMRKIRNRRKAQDRWDKLRKYVMYTWGHNAVDDINSNSSEEACCASFMVQSLPQNGSSMKRKHSSRMHATNFNRKISRPVVKKVTMKTQVAQSCVANSVPDLGGRFSWSKGDLASASKGLGVVKYGSVEHPVGLQEKDVPEARGGPTINDCVLPLPPSLEVKVDSEVTVSEIKRTFQSLYEYNMLLRKKLIDTQSELQSLTKRLSPSRLEK